MTSDPKVIYIVGAGRSGSTVLDTILGNHRDVESFGELTNAPRAWDNPDEYCACGVQAESCPFWRKVRRVWASKRPAELTEHDWRDLRDRYERLRGLANLLREGARGDARFQTYAAGLHGFYAALAEVAGTNTIVDSSKIPTRALALTWVDQLDVRFVHLVRDGRGIAWSLRKPYAKAPEAGVQNALAPQPVARSAAMWWIVNAVAERALRRLSAEKRICVRYEDFVEDPDTALRRIGTAADLDFGSVARMLARGDSFTVGHTVAGNRVRMAGAVRLKPDLEWHGSLSRRQRAVFWLIAGRMAARYGYTRRI
ncbi:hypothetical protein CKO28_15645 [Rhodovibrio sodomensis]|uniref:Sulfotransferase family protein n=1 Tax=Rhodovibrio sodomensis TaxID=1088 RepID=A0ABS1DHS1_9PROT|nr:sulfotransferase [Rhodovibrio sodomensis]MBK1669472.1 hypothetical protein [Rhodovibrio sodomensis]